MTILNVVVTKFQYMGIAFFAPEDKILFSKLGEKIRWPQIHMIITLKNRAFIKFQNKVEQLMCANHAEYIVCAKLLICGL